MSSREITLTIDSCLDDVFLVGLAVNKFCEYIRLTELESYQVEVSVVEAVTNAIKHAYGGERGHQVEIGIALAIDSIRVEVSDDGELLPDNLLNASGDDIGDRGFDELCESGRGLFIVKSFMDEVHYTSEKGRNTLRMAKSLVATMR